MEISALREKLKPLAFLLFTLIPAIDIINVTSLITGIVSVQEKYDDAYSNATWVLSAYAVTFGGMILFFGRVGDIIGHHLLFVIGIISFGIFSVLAAAVTNLDALIVFRAFQGVSAASTIPYAYALVATTFSGSTRDRALPVMAFAQSSAFGIGLLIGGAFVETYLGYRGTLSVSAGVSVLCGILSILSVKPSKKSGDSVKSLDVTGCLIFIAGILLIIVGLTDGGQKWASPKTYVPLIIGIALVFLFGIWESFSVKKFKGLVPLVPIQVWTFTNMKPLILGNGLNYAGLFEQCLMLPNTSSMLSMILL